MAKSIVTGLVTAKQKAVRQAEDDAEESAYHLGRMVDPNTSDKEAERSSNIYRAKDEPSHKIEKAAIDSGDWNTVSRISGKSLRGRQAYDVSKGATKAFNQSLGPLLNPWKQKSK